MPVYPPTPVPTLSGDTYSANRFLQNPTWVAHRLATLAEQRFRGTDLLKGREETTGGAVGYETVEGIFADARPETVAPGSEYTMTTVGTGPAGIARVVKQGKDTLVTDEDIKRRQMSSVERGLLKLANSAGAAVDASIVSLIATAVSRFAVAGQPTGYTGTTAKKWTESGALALRDILSATAQVRSLNLGYEPDVLLVDDLAWSALASDPVISAAMAREDKTNPIYTGKYDIIAGLEIVPTPSANLPGGTGTNAWVLDTKQLGFIATENLEGGYQQAGDLVQSKVIREDLNDAWRLRVRTNFAPVVTDPGAGFRISGVA